VREKIERRYANALGAAELAQNSVQGRMLEVQQSTMDMAGRSRLEQIRASIRGGPIAGEVTSGEAAPQPASPQQALPPHSQPQPGQG
jgi:phage shock protein A